MTKIETPVCVIGAGPAGATASLFLSQYGIKHVLADKSVFPRDKVCGEVFTGRVSHVLKELGIDYNDLITEGIISETRCIRFIVQPEHKSADYHFSEASTSILKGKRSVFDNYLNKTAKASSLVTYLEGVHLNSFDRHTEGVTIKSDDNNIEIKAQIVILCTGERVPFLQNQMPNEYPSKGETLLVWRQYWRNVHYEKNDYGCEAHLYTKPFSHYVIVNPLPNNLSLVEVAMTKADYKKHKISLESLFDESIYKPDKLKSRFQNASPLENGRGISMLLGKNPRLLSSERILLAGSAAGSIHPFTGFGVGHAMRMGQLAAFQAQKCLEKEDFSAVFMKNYNKVVQKRMKDDFRLGSIMHFIMRHFNLLLPILKVVIFSNRLKNMIAAEKFQHHSLNPLFYIKRLVKK